MTTAVYAHVVQYVFAQFFIHRKLIFLLTGILKSHSGFLSTGAGFLAMCWNSGSYNGFGSPLQILVIC